MTAQFEPVNDDASELHDPLARLDFAALAGGAAKLRPDRAAYLDVENASRNLTFGALERRTFSMAASWSELGLAAGERVLIVADASAACMIAVYGALLSGLDVGLAPPHLPAEEIAAFAIECGAAALAGAPVCGDLDIAEALFRAAALADRVRIVAALGGGLVDGAVALDPLGMRETAAAAPGSRTYNARIITRDISGQCHFHRQQTIVAAALDFVTRAQISTHIPILSTILPASFAGLVAGPVASLVAGAPLIQHAPFDAGWLARQIETAGPVHLIAPVMLSEDFAAAGLAHSQYLASLVLLTRFKQMPAELPAEPAGGILEADIPVTDLYGIGEAAAIAEARLPSGYRTAPLASQHILNLDGRDLVAARRKLHYLAANGRLDTIVAIEGVAISQNSEGGHG